MDDIAATVFIVDDDESIRVSLKRGLTKRGYEVSTFGSAAAFLEAYRPQMSGCLILDYGMPDMDGLELQDHLNHQGCGIPVIFITGHGGIPESVRAMRGGAVDFLEKPFRQDALVARIETAIAMDAEKRADRLLHDLIRERLRTLTDREKEIAEHIVTRPSEASSKYVARALDISPRTVDHHRARILEKLNVKSIAELIDIANKAQLFP